ncbi:MAG: YggU family protein [Chloroflexi bacterium]|nr:YggU family protein [Chloroflexota bacterium]
MSIFTESNNAVSFAIKVVPRARKNEIAGIEGDVVKIRLNAPPVEGKANVALIAFLAELLNVRRAYIEIVIGETSRRKVVRVRAIPARQIEEKILLSANYANLRE